MNAHQTPAEQVTLRRYVDPVRRFARWVILGLLLGGLLGFGASLLTGTSYESTTSVLVSPVASDTAVGTDVVRVDMATEAEVATSLAVAVRADQLLEGLPPSKDPELLREQVTARVVRDSRVLQLTFAAATADAAQRGAQAFADAYLGYRSDLATDQLAEATERLVERIDELEIELTEVSAQKAALEDGTAAFASVEIEEQTLLSELAVNQRRLADLRSVITDNASVIDAAPLPTSPASLGLVTLVVSGMIVGALAAATLALAVDALRRPVPVTVEAAAAPAPAPVAATLPAAAPVVASPVAQSPAPPPPAPAAEHSGSADVSWSTPGGSRAERTETPESSRLPETEVAPADPWASPGDTRPTDPLPADPRAAPTDAPPADPWAAPTDTGPADPWAAPTDTGPTDPWAAPTDTGPTDSWAAPTDTGPTDSWSTAADAPPADPWAAPADTAPADTAPTDPWAAPTGARPTETAPAAPWGEPVADSGTPGDDGASDPWAAIGVAGRNGAVPRTDLGDPQPTPAHTESSIRAEANDAADETPPVPSAGIGGANLVTARAAESVAQLERHLAHATDEEGRAVVVVDAGDGAAGPVAAAMAARLASQGGRALLIDAAGGEHGVHRLLGVAPAPGLGELLSGAVDEAAVTWPLADLAGVSVVMAGAAPREALGAAGAAEALATVLARHDRVVVIGGETTSCPLLDEAAWPGAVALATTGPADPRAVPAGVFARVSEGRLPLLGIVSIMPRPALTTQAS